MKWLAGIIVILICVGGLAYIVSRGKGNTPNIQDFMISGGEYAAKNAPIPTPIPPISLETVFVQNRDWVNALPKDKKVTMIATGDVIPARTVNHLMVTKNNFRWPFEKTADVLRSSDLTMVNLETPLTASCRPTVEGMIFCGNARAIEGMSWAGVDVATIANNHIGNYGVDGVEETKKILLANNITPVEGAPVIITINGMRFGFLAYNDIGAPEPGVSWAHDEQIKKDIAEIRPNADIVIVSYHWGVEYTYIPSDRQVALARLTVDSGADVVIGNHPHWIQPIELYKGKYIIYAHGNFVFDQEWSPETKIGVIGKYVFFDKKLVDVEYLPIQIIDYGQPYFLEGEKRGAVLRILQTISNQFVQAQR